MVYNINVFIIGKLLDPYTGRRYFELILKTKFNCWTYLEVNQTIKLKVYSHVYFDYETYFLYDDF